VAAVGMPDPVRVCVFVRPKSNRVITFEEIITFLKAKNTSVLYLPERIEVVTEIPLTPVGKIDKKKLREDIRVRIEAEGPGETDNLSPVFYFCILHFEFCILRLL
jgi:non-ribosomal peptide synthetase component E (peptide arylation enzyme)